MDLNFPGGLDVKESAHNSGDPRSFLGLGRSLEGGSSYTLLYSCLENSMDRGPWRAAVLELQRVRHD